MKRKKGEAMEMSFLAWWILGIAFLILAIAIISLLIVNGSNSLDFFKNLLRFGR